MTPDDRAARKSAQEKAVAEIAAGTLHSRARVRRWHVVHVNCDCAAYNHAMLRPPGCRGTAAQMRCIHCKKGLGDMEVQYHGYVYTVRPSDAVGIALQRTRANPRPVTPGL